MLSALFILCLLVQTLSFLPVASPTFIDDAFHLDFHHALLGPPQETNTLFHRPSADSKGSLLYTLSQRGILGAVNPKDGSVLWRQRIWSEDLSSKDRGLLQASSNTTSVIIGICGNLQTWHAVDGRLVWSRRLLGTLKAMDVFQNEKREHLIAILEEQPSNNYVHSFQLGGGSQYWRFQDSSGNTPYSLVTAQDRLFYLSLQPGLLKGVKVRTCELNASTGQQKGDYHTFGSEGEIASHESIHYVGTVGSIPVIIWSDKAFKTIRLGSLFHSRTTTLEKNFESGESVQSIKVHAPTGTRSSPHFLIHFQGINTHWAYVCRVDPATGIPSRVYKLDAISGQGAFSASSQESDVIFVRHSQVGISITSSSGSTSLQTWQMPQESKKVTEDFTVSHAVTEVAQRGMSNYSIRSVVCTPSGDWMMIRNGEISWIRHEGITGILAATFADVPFDHDLAHELAIEGQYGVVSAYLHRIRRHLKDLLSLSSKTASLLQNGMQSNAYNQSLQDAERSGNRFGFHQIAIIATISGRLAALDMAKFGQVIWSQQIVSPEPDSPWEPQQIDVEGPIATVHTRQGGLIKVSVLSGTIIDRQRTSNQTNSGVQYSVADTRGQRNSISVHSDGGLRDTLTIPTTEGVVIVTRSDTGKINGWNVNNGRSSHAWSFIAPPCENIEYVVYRHVHEPIASVGKVLGDRNVLYKYLNRNLVLMTTKNPCRSSVAFYLLESTSGVLLYTSRVQDVDLTRPISSALSENVIAYTLFSKSRTGEDSPDSPDITGHILGICELFASPFPNEREPLVGLSKASSRLPTHSLANDTSALHAIVQTYLVTDAISNLTFTTTMQGITPASLLAIMPNSNSIIAIPRYLLDSRRPIGRDPTATEIEEGLFRYHPVIELDPKWRLTHQRSLLGLSGAISNPTLLESTSLIFAFGDVDIFGTRVSPIGGFDILGKGFSKFQLVITVVALAAGTAILAPMVNLRENHGSVFIRADIIHRFAKSRLTWHGRLDGITAIELPTLFDNP